MGKYDKDRFQKELALRFCLAHRMIPFLEVIVPNVTELSETIEVLTDIDVLGIERVGDGDLRRTIFDCKTKSKMSSINRAFWAAGVKQYARCDDAHVILKNKAVHNHRVSALSIDVDLHDEDSFMDLGRTLDASFPADDCYQAQIERWNSVGDAYSKNAWSAALYDLARNQAPLSHSPWSVFRRALAELRGARGFFDPDKATHPTIFLDVTASVFVLWAAMGRDIRRFYEPSMGKSVFESTLRYYLWGGKDSYSIRQQMRELQNRPTSHNGSTIPLDLPSWDLLVDFAGIIVAAPQSILECAHACRELSIRLSVGSIPEFDKTLAARFSQNTRIRQFVTALSDYLVSAGGLPKDLARKIQAEVFSV